MKRIHGQPRVYNWYENVVSPRLATALYDLGFSGPLGIDAFVYRDLSGSLKLKTMVELNSRFTMGRIAYEVGKHVASGSVGCFQIHSHSQIRKSKTPRFLDFAKELQRRHPVVLTTDKKPRIGSGSFPLNDPLSAKQFLTVYHVRQSMGELLV